MGPWMSIRRFSLGLNFPVSIYTCQGLSERYFESKDKYLAQEHNDPAQGSRSAL